MATPSAFTIEVDWNGDDDFSDTGENVTADVVQFQCTRGRDYASQLTGRSVAGRAQILLLNTTGKYSSFNTASPIYGGILPNRKVRIRSTAPTAAVLWTGFLETIIPAAGGVPMATLKATGALARIGDRTNLISPEPMQNAMTDEVLDAILDAAGWPALARDIEAGSVPLGDWYVEEKVALDAAYEIEEAEGGLLREGIDWDIVFEARYHRLLEAASTTSQGTFSDDPTADPSYLASAIQEDPLREIYNLITATVQPFTSAALAVLWTLDAPPALSPGASITYIATVGDGYVSAWTTPVVGTDVVQTGVANGDIDVAVEPRAQSMLITITNNGAATSNFSLVQARGVQRVAGDPYKVQSADLASQALYGQRAYPLPSPWYPNANYAQAAADYFISLKKDPHPILTIPLPASAIDALFAHAVSRDLSDRVTLEAESAFTRFGISDDFYVESIAHQWSAGRSLVTTWQLSPAAAVEHYWLLGDATYGVLDSTTKLAY